MQIFSLLILLSSGILIAIRLKVHQVSFLFIRKKERKIEFPIMRSVLPYKWSLNNKHYTFDYLT